MLAEELPHHTQTILVVPVVELAVMVSLLTMPMLVERVVGLDLFQDLPLDIYQVMSHPHIKCRLVVECMQQAVEVVKKTLVIVLMVLMVGVS